MNVTLSKSGLGLFLIILAVLTFAVGFILTFFGIDLTHPAILLGLGLGFVGLLVSGVG